MWSKTQREVDHMIVNTRDTKQGILVIVCDDEILGKKFEEGEKQLDLTSDFYKGKVYTPAETADIMRNAEYLHLVGEKSVQLGIDEKLVGEENIIRIAGVPHAEVSRV